MLSNLAENTVLVMVQAILAIIRNVEIFPSVVVIVADADALSPSGSREPGLLGYVRERTVVIVVVKMVGRGIALRESL